MDPQTSSNRQDHDLYAFRPPENGMIQVDNVANVLAGFQHPEHSRAPGMGIDQGDQHSPADTHSSEDGPAPLRRNQACLQCRRRKLKCDATRPHCATCQRSHAHLCRTSPKSNPVLTCTYDDVPESDLQSGQKKRQRRAPGTGTTGAGRKRKTGEESHSEDQMSGLRKAREEKEALERKIAELQNQLSQNANSTDASKQPPAQPFWEQANPAQLSTFGPQIQPPVNPESPTPFLDMLSSAAAAAGQPTATPWTNKPSPPKPWWEQTDELSPFGSSVGAASAAASTEPVQGIPHPQQRTSSYSSSHPSSGGTPAVQAQQPDWQNSFKDSHKAGGPWRDVETISSVLDEAMELNLGGNAPIVIDSVNNGADAPVDGNPTSQFLLDLLWPNWPANLPEPSLMSHLIDVYFDSVAGMGRIIHRERFMSRMLLPPSHSGFPHVSLLHAICAVSAHFTAWVNTPAPKDREDKSAGPFTCSADPEFSKSDFTTQHTTLAQEEIMKAIRTGEKTFDVLRAMIILHRGLMYNAAWIEAWAVLGLAARCLLPMGLAARNSHSGYKPATLMDPKDDVEREERRGVLWFTVMMDVSSAAMSGWGTSLVMDEIPLPTGTAQWKVGLEMTENPQDLDSLDLWTNHPVVDSFVMHTKATVLAGRVARFQRKWRDRKLRPNDDLHGMQKAEFKQLDSAISCFIMSMPAALKNPLAKTHSSGKSGIDSDLLSAHMIPHAATIMLHECFADLEDPDDRSAIRIRHAAHAVFGLFNLVASSSVDLAAVLHPNLGCDAAHAASRTLVAMLRIALNNDDNEVASSIFQELQVLLMTYQQIGERLHLGLKQAEMLQMMINAALSPTYDLFACHIPFPKHPRHLEGVTIDVSATSDIKQLGRFFVTMLNVKRGYWRHTNPGSVSSTGSAHIGYSSSAGLTPESSSERGNSSGSTFVETPPEIWPKVMDEGSEPAFWRQACTS